MDDSNKNEPLSTATLVVPTPPIQHFEADDEEKRLAKMNRHKIEEQWRNVLRQEKLESLRKELGSLQSYHEEEVGQKDAIIARLEQGFGHSKDQYRSSFATHLERIDELSDLYEERLLYMEQDFKEKLEFLSHEYSSEREVIIAQHETNKRVLLSEIAALKAQERQVQARDERERHQAIEEVKGRHREEINSLRFVLDGKIEDLEEQHEAAQMEYLSRNDYKAVDFEVLCAKDSKMKREIEDLIRRIDKLQGAAKHVQAASRRNHQQRAEKNQLLTEKKTVALERYQLTKGEMDHTRDSQHKRIASLTTCAKTCKLDLQEKHDLAERILKLVHAVNKLESENNGGDDGKEEKEEEEKAENIQIQVDLVEEANKMCSRALLDLHAQEEQLRQVKQQNKDLKAKLKRFKDGTSLNDDVIRKDNPLIVVNGRLG